MSLQERYKDRGESGGKQGLDREERTHQGSVGVHSLMQSGEECN